MNQLFAKWSINLIWNTMNPLIFVLRLNCLKSRSNTCYYLKFEFYNIGQYWGRYCWYWRPILVMVILKTICSKTMLKILFSTAVKKRKEQYCWEKPHEEAKWLVSWRNIDVSEHGLVTLQECSIIFNGICCENSFLFWVVFC